MGIRRWAHYGNVQDSVTLAKHHTLIPDKTDDMGLWTFMKENKRFWLLPITIVVLLVGGLVAWDQQYLEPSMLVEGVPDGP